MAPSVDELLNQGLPRHIDSLSFDIWSRAKEDNDTAMSISVGLSRTRASCYITSNNEVWFRGKIQQINEFFERRRLWYDKLGGRDKIPAVFGGLDAIVLVSIPIFLGLGKYLIAIIAGISAFIISRCYKAFLQGRLFPETDIGLFEERPRLSREVLMLIFAGVAAVGTATTVLIKIIEMGGP